MPPKKGPARIFKLPRLLDSSPDPIAIINDQFEVVYANSACCGWLGTASEELIGKSLNYSPVADDGGARFNGICPSPQLFTGELNHGCGQIYVDRNGQRVFRKASFCRLQTGDPQQVAVLVVATGEDFIQKPCTGSGNEAWHDILSTLWQAESAVFNSESLVGTSDEAIRIRRQVAVATKNQADCLVVGPAGSGREHVARTIFHERRLSNAQLVPIHCSIADSELIQSAIKNWVFDRRNNNSSDWLLLLDVDRLSVDAQSELLGYTRIPDFQMPIMATATESLLSMADQGQFSRSLALHLTIQAIELQALSQRMQDLPLLAQTFIELNNETSTNQIAGLSDEVLSTFNRYHWPRNVAELRQCIDAAHDACSGTTIGMSDLPEDFKYALSAAQIGAYEPQTIDLSAYLERIEKELITRALAQSGNNKTQAARLLGVSRARLLRRSASLGIEDPRRPNDQLIDESEFKEAD